MSAASSWSAASVLSSPTALPHTLQSLLKALGNNFPADGIFVNTYYSETKEVHFLAHATHQSAQEIYDIVPLDRNKKSNAQTPSQDPVYRVDNIETDPFTHAVCRVHKSKNYGIEPRNAEQSFAFEVLNDPDIKLVGLTGKAGTGKTLLALAAALSQLSDYKQILLARPIVALSNKDIGFLPGDATEKVAPYMQPLFDNLNVIKRQFSASSSEVKRLEDMQKSGQLVIEALAFIRGRSLSETYCIIDEAQNLTPHEIKTIITRAGEGTKMVFTGDIQQIDQPYLDSQSNGLVYMIDRMRDQNLFAHVNLVKGERSQLSELASTLM